MSFAIIRSYGDELEKELRETKEPGELIFRSDEEINEEFMRLLRSEYKKEEQFLHDPDIIKYLNIFGIYEKSPYVYKAKEWIIGPLFKDKAWVRERFVGDFPSLLKLGCIAVKYSKQKIVLVNQKEEKDNTKIHKIDFFTGGRDYLGPIIEKRDIYMYIGSYERSYLFGGIMSSYLKGKVEIMPLGKNRNIEIRLIDKKRNIDISERNLQEYLYELETKSNSVTRETDAQFFQPEKAVVYPYRQNIREYFNAKGYKMSFGEEYIEKLNREYIFDVQGECNFKQDHFFKRMAEYQLLYVNGEWKLRYTCSCKYPEFFELIRDILTIPKWCGDEENKITKVFVMVLNCDEVCAADQYWDYICFFTKHETGSRVIEICDQGKALLEFHELLQKSTDLPEK